MVVFSGVTRGLAEGGGPPQVTSSLMKVNVLRWDFTGRPKNGAILGPLGTKDTGEMVNWKVGIGWNGVVTMTKNGHHHLRTMKKKVASFF